MPYQSYSPTWNNPYLPAYNQGQPVTQQAPIGYQPQPVPAATQAVAYQQAGGIPKVDGPTYDGRSGYRDSMGRYATRPAGMGYDGMRYGYDMQGLRDAMSTAAPEEREKMMREMRAMLGM